MEWWTKSLASDADGEMVWKVSCIPQAVSSATVKPHKHFSAFISFVWNIRLTSLSQCTYLYHDARNQDKDALNSVLLSAKEMDGLRPPPADPCSRNSRQHYDIYENN